MAGLVKKGLKNILQKSGDDVVFLSALRTPSTRSYKGGLKDAYDHEMLYHVRPIHYASHANSLILIGPQSDARAAPLP